MSRLHQKKEYLRVDMIKQQRPQQKFRILQWELQEQNHFLNLRPYKDVALYVLVLTSKQNLHIGGKGLSVVYFI